MYPQNSRVAVQPPARQSVAVFGDRAFRGVIKGAWGLQGGPAPPGLVSTAEETRRQTHRGVTSPGHGGAVSQPSSRGGTSGGLVSSHLPVLCPSPASLPPLPMGRLFLEPSGLPAPGLSTLLPENHTQADPVRGWGRHAPSGGPALLPSPVPSLCGLPATAPCAVPLPQPLPPPAGGGARAWAAAGLARVGSSVSEAASDPAGQRHSAVTQVPLGHLFLWEGHGAL